MKNQEQTPNLKQINEIGRSAQWPFTHGGRRCQVISYVAGVRVRVRWADVSPREVSEGLGEAEVSCLNLKSASFVA